MHLKLLQLLTTSVSREQTWQWVRFLFLSISLPPQKQVIYLAWQDGRKGKETHAQVGKLFKTSPKKSGGVWFGSALVCLVLCRSFFVCWDGCLVCFFGGVFLFLFFPQKLHVTFSSHKEIIIGDVANLESICKTFIRTKVFSKWAK